MLFSILRGLDEPTRGRIFFRDEEVSGAGRDRERVRRTLVGFVFQFYT